MSTVAQFLDVINKNGSPVTFHRADNGTPCPCRTPEGYRDPIWHIQHPNSAMCNEAGFLPGLNDVEISVKAFIQPIQSTRATRLRSQFVLEAFGEIEESDQLGIFPLTWGGTALDFYEWGASGEDWIAFEGRHFTVVHANKISDPDGGADHHWEVGLRLINPSNL